MAYHELRDPSQTLVRGPDAKRGALKSFDPQKGTLNELFCIKPPTSVCERSLILKTIEQLASQLMCPFFNMMLMLQAVRHQLHNLDH